MGFTQQKFLNSSIRGFQASLGWSNQTSQLNVGLVDDARNNDGFTPGNIGDPIHFNYQGWVFNGLLQNWRQSGDSGGSPLYEVTLVDPREILEGTQLILDGYTGPTFGMPNLINVYGYLESFGFGNSDINDGGISWLAIAQSVNTLTTNFIDTNIYGGPIKFSNSRYAVNLLQLPQLPYYYRVGGSNISLMDFIVDVCEAGGADFFITMSQTNDLLFTIQVNVVYRRQAQALGQIAAYIANNPLVTARNYGHELLNNTTGKFVVGGAVEQIYVQFEEFDIPDGEDVSHTKLKNQPIEILDGTIWPFWGFDADGNAIMGQKQFDSNYHNFVLDSRAINVFGIGAYYPTSVGEMRAALDSYETWMYYLSLQDGIKDSPQFGRYTTLGGVSPLSDRFIDILNGANSVDDMKKIPWVRLAATTGRQARLASKGHDNATAENTMRLYDYVRAFATEYYGRKFMVQTPFIYTKVESETFNVVQSQVPTDSGFVDESDWIDAIGNNLLPFDIDRLTTEEGKIEAYVRYDSFGYLDLSQISPDDYIMSDNGQSVFIKVRVEPRLVYLDLQTQYSPRAVVELSGPVRVLNRYGDSTNFGGAIVSYLQYLFSNDFTSGANKYGLGGDKNKIDAAVASIINTWMQEGASESVFRGLPGLALLPTMVGLPLRSNVSTYGPYYALGSNGKMEFERDESLVPWNYAGYEIMDLVGQSKVIDAIIAQQISETGTLEFPGVPAVNLGETLIQGGPVVTDVRVSIGEGGATTTYEMAIGPKFGRFAKANVDRLTRLSKTAQRFRRQFRAISKIPPPNAQIFKTRMNVDMSFRPAATKPHSSSVLFHGECLPGDTDNTFHISTCIQPDYHNTPQIYDQYQRKGIMSLDGMFVPFSTDTSASGIPHYQDLTVDPSGDDSGSSVSRGQIDPFVINHGISVIARGDTMEEDSSLYESDGYDPNSVYRGVCLRGPVTIAGWGYDINDKPVPTAPSGDPSNPNGDAGSVFPSNVQQRPDLWKVGPLDARWDDSRGVWSAGGGSSGPNSTTLFRATAQTTINPYGSGNITLLSNGKSVLGVSWLGQPICAGQRLYALKDQGAYYITISEYSSLNVITNQVCTSGNFTITRNTIYFPSAYTVVSG